MFHSRYFINYGRIFSRIISKQNTIDHDVINFLVSLVSTNDYNLELFVQSISLLESKNMFIYSFKDKAVKVIFKESIDFSNKETTKKPLDEFDANSNDDVIYTDFMKNFCSCRQYQSKYKEFLVDNQIDLKEHISLKKLLENDEKLGIDLVGLLGYELVQDERIIQYDYSNVKTFTRHLKDFVKGEYGDINLVYTNGSLICPHLLSCNILLKNGSIPIYKSRENKIVLLGNEEEQDDDDIEIISENKILNFYANTNQFVYKLEIESLNDWLYLQYNII